MRAAAITDIINITTTAANGSEAGRTINEAPTAERRVTVRHVVAKGPASRDRLEDSVIKRSGRKIMTGSLTHLTCISGTAVQGAGMKPRPDK